MTIRSFKTSSITSGKKRNKFWDQSTRLAVIFDILCVAGGGGTAFRPGAGAGGVVLSTGVTLTKNTEYTVVVGNGGTGGSSSTNGGNSNVTGLGISLTQAVGGGLGVLSQSVGANGGCGGGARQVGSSATAGGIGSQGGNGGAGNGGAATEACGGGGGMGANGVTSTYPDDGMPGGNGITTYSPWGAATNTGQNVSGTYYYAGGGASAMAYSSPTSGGRNPVGGLGGGGRGFAYGTNPGVAVAGSPNTGGGGGGNNGNGVPGGSGVVIFRAPKDIETPITTGSPTVVTDEVYKYITFTGTGTITV